MDLMREPESEDEVEPGALIAFFRWVRGWNQTKLARRARMDKSRISRYESGEDVPEPPTMDRITAAAEIRPPLVAPIQTFIRLLRKVLASDELVEPTLRAPATPPEEVQRAVGGVVEHSLSLARVYLRVLWSIRSKKKPGPPTAADWERVEALLERLRRYDPGRRRLLIQESEAYKDWLLCVRLCDESERAAAHSAADALEWAALACDIACQAPGTKTWRSRLQGYSEPFRANALRVGSEYQAAKAAFERGRRLWRAGKDDLVLLDEGRLLDIEASFCRDQRQFTEALKLHDQALETARPDQTGIILLNKAYTLEEKGDHEASIGILEQAAASTDLERQPRLYFGIRFNLAGNLLRMGRAEAAAPIVREVRELAERLRNDLDLIRTSWLEAQLLAALGRREKAIAALEQVRREFEKRGLIFDYALASLDLALVFREEGRLSEVLELAVEMVEIFEAQGVHREALSALILFRDAAEKQAVTVDLVQRLQEYLKKARANPKLRFEA